MMKILDDYKIPHEEVLHNPNAEGAFNMLVF